MKRTLLLLTFCIISLCSFGQNYNCFNTSEVTYFISGRNFLRGMRIDSVRVDGADTIYYPYRTCRAYNYLRLSRFSGCDSFHMNTNGGSWLGGRVVKHPDGTFVFDNNYGGSVTIKTQANLGDTFSFYQDSTQISFWAQVTSIDTQTILGTIDSVKTYEIHSDSAGTAFTADWLNHFTFKISKTKGFVRAFDLYTFPYRKLDSIRQVRFFDYYLDHLLDNVGFGDLGVYRNNYPDTFNSVFNIVRFRNLTEKQLYNRHAGDVLGTVDEYENATGISRIKTFDSVTSIDLYTPDSIVYSGVDSITETYSSTGYNTYRFYGTMGGGSASNHRLMFDMTKLPEELNNDYFLYYFPNDTGDTSSPCYFSALYTCEYKYFRDDTGSIWPVSSYFGYGIAPYFYSTTYRPGVGIIGKNRSPNDYPHERRSLLYLYINGTSCYGLRPAVLRTIENANPKEFVFDVYPNPVINQLNMKFYDKSTKFVSVYNIVGQNIYFNSCVGELKIDTKAWFQGQYVIVVNDEYGNRQVKEIMVVH